MPTVTLQEEEVMGLAVELATMEARLRQLETVVLSQQALLLKMTGEPVKGKETKPRIGFLP